MRKTEAAKRKYERAGAVKKYDGLVLAILAIGAFALAFRMLVGSLG